MKGDPNLALTCKWIQFQLLLFFFPLSKANTAAAACPSSPAHWSILCNQTESILTLISISLSSMGRKWKKIPIKGPFTVMAVDSSSIYNMAAIISTLKTLNTCVHSLLHTYKWLVSTYNYCHVIIKHYPCVCRQKKSMCAPGFLQGSSLLSLTGERSRHYIDPSLPARPPWSVCSMHTQLCTHSACWHCCLCVCMCMCACVNMHRSCVIFSQGNVSSLWQLPPPLFGNDSLV